MVAKNIEKTAREKARQKVYQILQLYLACLDTYLSTVIYPKNNDQLTQKFITTTRDLQSIIQSLEDA